MNINAALKYSLMLLLAVALVWGYVTYKSESRIPYSPSSTASTDSTSTVAPDRATLLKKPTASTTQADLKAHFALVAQNALPTDTIRISSCKPAPLVSSMKIGSTLTLMNLDAATHTIAFTPNKTFILAPKASKTIKADFGTTIGLYGFTCDRSAGFAGMALLLN